MAVISTNGVVGVIYDVSRFYSTVISLLNTNMKISSKLLKNDYFGSLEWDGKNYRHAILNEIPYHVKVERGDTVVTSGYSAIFPEGVMIGTIEDFKIKGGNFYEINIALSTDFKHLTFVSVVSNLKKEGQKNLENTFPND